MAHVFSYDELGPVAQLRRVAAGGFDGDRVNALGVADYADRSTDELLALVNEHLQPGGLPALFGGRIALTDGLIHQPAPSTTFPTTARASRSRSTFMVRTCG